MENKISFHPEIEALYNEIYYTMLNESGRGAILIATSFTDDFLTKLIECILPGEISKTNKEKLFKYPGTISSYSSKIELAYAFRIIDKEIYDSLNILRRIRNDAAHSSEEFNLNNISEKMKAIYNMGVNYNEILKNTAKEMMIKNKTTILRLRLAEKLTPQEIETAIDNTLKDNLYLNKLETDELPSWELLLWLCLICNLLVIKREAMTKVVSKIDTWDNLPH